MLLDKNTYLSAIVHGFVTIADISEQTTGGWYQKWELSEMCSFVLHEGATNFLSWVVGYLCLLNI